MSAPSEIDNYEDVTQYTLDDATEQALLEAQNELTFIWSNREGWPVGVIMSYVFREGRFWVTASSQRKRVSAVRRDPRVSVVVSSHGSRLGAGKALTYKGTATVHDDEPPSRRGSIRRCPTPSTRRTRPGQTGSRSSWTRPAA